MSTKRLAVLIGLLLITVWSLAAYYFTYRVNVEQYSYTQRQIADLNVTWTAVQQIHQRGKDAYFQTYIMQPAILDLLKQAQIPSKRDHARSELFEQLKPVYDHLSQQGVYQFQFTLPNNVSLLRLHAPLEFGDDLTSLRESFRLANTRLEPTSGFELGRVLPGLRSVYPIIYNGQHLGAVEFSNAFETLRRDIALLDNSREYALVLNWRVHAAVFEGYKSYYVPSLFNQAWLQENPEQKLPNASSDLSEYAHQAGKPLRTNPEVLRKMELGHSFAVPFRLNEQYHVASFLAINDIEGHNAAYLVALSPAPLLDDLHADLVNNISVTTILIVLLGWTLFSILRNREELRIAATAFDVQEGITITSPAGKILKVNKAFTRLTGYSAEDVIGKTPAILSSGRQDKDFYKNMWQSLKTNGSWKGEIWNRRKDGEFYAEWLTITAVYDRKNRVTHYVGAFLDITQRKEDEEQIRKLAFYDPLTELPNRRLLVERIEHAQVISARTQRYGALLFIDLDNFKTLNDTKGHNVGDMLLLEVASRLTKQSRESDMVVRLGGDEFVILYEELSRDEHKASLEMEHFAEGIRDCLNQPYYLNDYEHYSSPSIGVALFRGHQISLDELLKNADSAMYQAKHAGRNTIRLFDPLMQEALEHRLKLEDDLRYAIEHKQLELYYQPQLNELNQVKGAEVLIRWRHPQQGLISPAQFIPIAEDSGLIIEIGDWVLQQACNRLGEWKNQPSLRHLTLSANVSVRQLRQADFVRKVTHWLDYYQLQPGQLKLELTESMVLDDLEDTIAKMQQLKQRGVLFSMDDFGTGYSSLSSIKRLPLDQLKIDQSFVHDIGQEASSLVLTDTIIAMGKALGLHVLAEGVETEAQRQALIGQGCYDFQGYYFARPLPYHDFIIYLNS
ncbi:MAG: EAL domain-containing protein [Thiomicrospira sp.]|uniref:bifunctional diguanylate cyclase/phosphodiesterase n=1 Tax=Thiomicrospira sp. TaxID=935 RepID=UPI001A0694A2|nr:EAL domain-containing protein [Thiomicrospira sp.]MBE0494233.1 EAL domain-containing protein [Thiomicrospira sp.]